VVTVTQTWQAALPLCKQTQLRQSLTFARVIAACSYHFVIAVWRAKEHNPSRKSLEYHR